MDDAEAANADKEPDRDGMADAEPDRDGMADAEASPPKKNRCASFRKFVKSPRFYIFLSHSMSTWGDRMWHFAMSLFLVELYDKSLFLAAVYGLTASGSHILLGALVGDWVDKNPRMRVVRLSLSIQNSSVILCALVLLTIFLCKVQISPVWNGWLMVACYVVVITIGVVAQLAGTAMTIAIQRDWIVVVADSKEKLAGMNATMRQIDQLSKLLAPMTVGQVMTFLSLEFSCGVIAAWNLFSMVVEYWLLRHVFRSVPALATKGAAVADAKRAGETEAAACELHPLAAGEDNEANNTEEKSAIDKSSKPQVVPNTKSGSWLAILGKPLRTLRYGWVAYYRQSAFLPGLGLAFLYMTVLGFDGITTGYAYAQGVSTSVLSIMVGLSATLGLVGTVLYLRARRRCGLVRTGALFSLAQVCCLLLCVASVFAPGSPLDLTAPLHKPRLDHHAAEPTVAYEANGTWFQNVTTNVTATVQPQILDYTSISLFFAGAILSRVGLWGFDLSVTQIFQETVAESERGVVTGVQSSLNSLLNVLRFIMVMVAPSVHHFGALILVSVAFVTAGGLLYTHYAVRTLGPGGLCTCGTPPPLELDGPGGGAAAERDGGERGERRGEGDGKKRM
ncbi:unnamed protein product [Lampetra fluviatilis]